MYVQIKVFGDVQFERKLLRMGARAYEAAPVLETINFFLSRITREQFETEGGRSGHHWAPLAASTVAHKGASEGILVDTGDLRDSFIYGDINNIWMVTNEFSHWGSDIPYGVFHQRGTKNIPMRKPFELTDADRVAIVKSIQRWITTGDLINLEVGIV